MVEAVVEALDVTLLAVAEQVRALHVEAYAREARLVGVESLPPMERSASQIQGLSENFFGAFVNGELAGGVSESEGDEAWLEICSLAVSPAFQRRGVGRALIETSISRAGGRPMLVSTAAANLPAISLYQSLGFRASRYSLVPNLELQLVHLERPGSKIPAKGTSSGKPLGDPPVEGRPSHAVQKDSTVAHEHASDTCERESSPGRDVWR